MRLKMLGKVVEGGGYCSFISVSEGASTRHSMATMVDHRVLDYVTLF